jgi:hypothetical protein
MTRFFRSGTKNLLVFHLESIAWQKLAAFPEAFPNLHRLMETSRVYRSYFSSATSTQMTISAFMHGNDGELDAASGISQPAGDTKSLFATLKDAGYETAFLCVTPTAKPMLPLLSASLPPVWSTNDFGDLIAQFERHIEETPFAIYIWNLLPHIETDFALAPFAKSLEDLIGGACAVTDTLLGRVLDILRHRSLLEETTIVVYGDHGDDHGTHGFKNGLLHGLEPFTPLVHAPLVISDSDVPAGTDNRLASTVDLAPTCLELIGLPGAAAQYPAGTSLTGEQIRSVAFSQNFTANQPDAPHLDVRKCFAAIDRTHALMISSRGLEFYGHKLDPGNHSNLLHHFELADDGALRLLDPRRRPHPHFNTVRHMWLNDRALQNTFAHLHRALKDHVAAKNAYVKARKTDGEALALLDLQMFDRINRCGRDTFFGWDEPKPEESLISTGPRRSEADGVFRRILETAAVAVAESR